MGKLRWLPFLFLCGGTLAAWLARDRLTANGIAAFSPKDTALAAAFLLALYAAKSLSVAFPLSVLEAAGGLLFPLPLALIINLLGVALAQLIPFFLGRRERSAFSSLSAKYPKLSLSPASVHPARTVFLLRLGGAAPGDLVSMYLGAAGLPPLSYLAGGILGSLPRVAAATVLGASLWAFGTPRFWLSLLPGAVLTVCSLLLWRLWKQ